jgi:hypothetical protein
MRIVAHRGYWRKAAQQNSLTALLAALQQGWGVETDVRDYRGEPVISHDPPRRPGLALEKLLSLYADLSTDAVLALNVKADGLQEEVLALLRKYRVRRYMLFDLSVPDALAYIRVGGTVFTRQSEYEPSPAFYETAAGVVMDGFHSDWIRKEDVSRHMEASKAVFIISPELHQRPLGPSWKRYKQQLAQPVYGEVMLCTDYPEAAEQYFNQMKAGADE